MKKERGIGSVVQISVSRVSEHRLLCSIDFTFTGNRTNSTRSFLKRGSRQTYLHQKRSQHINCIVAVILIDGLNLPPSALFTYNPAFSTAAAFTKIQKKNPHCPRLLGIRWVTTKSAIIECFISVRSIRRLATSCLRVLTWSKYFARSFNSRSFPKVYVTKWQFHEGVRKFWPSYSELQNHAFYHAEVRQFLSPNDNLRYGTSTAAWWAQTAEESSFKGCCALTSRAAIFTRS